MTSAVTSSGIGIIPFLNLNSVSALYAKSISLAAGAKAAPQEALPVFFAVRMGRYLPGGGEPPEPELATAYLAALESLNELAGESTPLSGLAQVHGSQKMESSKARGWPCFMRRACIDRLCPSAIGRKCNGLLDQRRLPHCVPKLCTDLWDRASPANLQRMFPAASKHSRKGG